MSQFRMFCYVCGVEYTNNISHLFYCRAKKETINCSISGCNNTMLPKDAGRSPMGESICPECTYKESHNFDYCFACNNYFPPNTHICTKWENKMVCKKCDLSLPFGTMLEKFSSWEHQNKCNIRKFDIENDFCARCDYKGAINYPFRGCGACSFRGCMDCGKKLEKHIPYERCEACQTKKFNILMKKMFRTSDKNFLEKRKDSIMKIFEKNVEEDCEPPNSVYVRNTSATECCGCGKYVSSRDCIEEEYYTHYCKSCKLS